MVDEKLIRARKIAKERIVEQFADRLDRDLLVDCGALGTAIVLKGNYGHDIHWLEPEQIVTLKGQLVA